MCYISNPPHFRKSQKLKLNYILKFKRKFKNKNFITWSLINGIFPKNLNFKALDCYEGDSRISAGFSNDLLNAYSMNIFFISVNFIRGSSIN
jgi:hypothetical protein